ncbi:MAG: hypothetical protein ACFB4I_10055 [Cyanophyceae cyanobacterium]
MKLNPSYRVDKLVAAGSNWQAVYVINEQYYIEDIVAYAMIKNGPHYEFVPITLPEIHLSQTLQDYTLKDGFVGLINPENELIVNDYLVEDIQQLDIAKIKESLKKNRIKLD